MKAGVKACFYKKKKNEGESPFFRRKSGRGSLILIKKVRRRLFE